MYVLTCFITLSPLVREIENSTMDSSRSHEVILEQEQQRRESLSSSEEQRQSQVDLLVLESQLPRSDVAQNITTERIVDNLSQGLSEEQTISTSLPHSSREEESRKRSLANSELVKIVSSVLLDEDVELDEGFSFSSSKSSLKESVTESDFTDNEHSESRVTKMHSGLSKSELARKERERLHLIRTKVNAAVAIQRWFRKWTSIKRERRERDMMMRNVTKEQEQLCEEVAALTIQLAWRKHMRTKFEKKKTINNTDKPKKAAPTSASGKTEQNDINIYGRPIQEGPKTAVVNSRKVKGRGRSPYMKYQPSPAALSYNMAMDLYHPLGSRQGSRTAMVTASPRMKSGCMKRTYGWTHDANFSRKINGKRILVFGSLSKGVFERRKSTRSVLFEYLGGGFA